MRQRKQVRYSSRSLLRLANYTLKTHTHKHTHTFECAHQQRFAKVFLGASLCSLAGRRTSSASWAAHVWNRDGSCGRQRCAICKGRRIDWRRVLIFPHASFSGWTGLRDALPLTKRTSNWVCERSGTRDRRRRRCLSRVTVWNAATDPGPYRGEKERKASQNFLCPTYTIYTFVCA